MKEVLKKIFFLIEGSQFINILMQNRLESLLNLYPKLTPINSKCMPFKCRQTKMTRDIRQRLIPPIDSKSLVSKYSLLCNSSSKDLLPDGPQPRKKGSLSCLKDYDTCVMDSKNQNSMRIEKAINNMHQYTQELRNTLVKEYKNKRKKMLRSKLKMQELTQTIQREVGDNNPELSQARIPLVTKYSSKNVALKTLNVLYRAIIDESFHHRKQEEFQLQANKLPIIDRFQVTKRKQKFRQESHPKVTMDPLEQRRTMSQYYSVQPRQRQKLQPQPRQIREDVDIVPWSIQQERLE